MRRTGCSANICVGRKRYEAPAAQAAAFTNPLRVNFTVLILATFIQLSLATLRLEDGFLTANNATLASFENQPGFTSFKRVDPQFWGNGNTGCGRSGKLLLSPSGPPLNELMGPGKGPGNNGGASSPGPFGGSAGNTGGTR